jgi:hypothetical protein
VSLFSRELKEYCDRTIEDVDHTTLLLYVRYQCRNTRQTFSTLGEEYMALIGYRKARKLPYILTHRGAISQELMTIIHDSIISSGLVSGTTKIRQARENRYMDLFCDFLDDISLRKEKNDEYIQPTSPSIEQYMAQHKVLGEQSLTQTWLDWSEHYSVQCRKQMKSIEIRRVLPLFQNK